MMTMIKFLKVFILACLLSAPVFAQVSDRVSSVKFQQAVEGKPLELRAELINYLDIAQMSIAFKSFGKSDYIKRDMMVQGNAATVTIPAEYIIPPSLEYYLIITLKNGNTENYPVGAPTASPASQISITPVSEKDKQILLLSPEPGEMVIAEELFVSLSFIKAPDNIKIEATKIYIDNLDISDKAIVTGDLVIFSAENFPNLIPQGAHSLKVEIYSKDGSVYNSIYTSFQLVTAEIALAMGKKLKSRANLRAESRNVSYNNVSTWYNNVQANAEAEYSDWKFSGNAYFTSEEKSNLQPMNRYSASIESSWLSLKVGDTYPTISSLVMEGKRLRGFNGALNLGFFNVQAAYGEVARETEGKLLATYSSNSDSLLQSNIVKIDAAKYGNPYGLVDFGTYSRNVFAIRPSFGSGESFQLGFSYLHSSDDKKSISFGPRPQENIVAGADLFIGIDDRNIILTSQAAISFVNSDITYGDLSDTQIDSLFGPTKFINVDPTTIKDIKNIASKFITINQFLSPLNPQDLSSLAAETAIQLNYFGNNLKASYVYRGNEFQSFGQSYTRTDVKGINLVDRLRIIDNKVFLSFGYENLKDNLQKTKIATTTFETINAAISYFPRMDFPNIRVEYSHNKNNNGIQSHDPVNSLSGIDDATNTVSVQLSYDLTAGVKHGTSLSLSTSNREDNSIRQMNSSNTFVNFGFNSFWTSRFTTYFNGVYFNSEIAGVKYKYEMFSAGARYRMFDDKLELMGAFSPSFGDFKRVALDFTAAYNIIQNFDVVFQMHIYKMESQPTSSEIGLMTRLGI
jgi:hypothetical protein